MVVSPIIPVILVLGILIFLNKIPKYGYLVSNIFLLVLFLFAAANIQQNIGVYYSIMVIGTFVFFILKFGPKDVSRATIGGQRLGGWGLSIINFFVGAIFFVFIRTLQSRAGGVIIGVPSLAVTSTTLAFMNPALTASLGYIENRFFFGLFDVLARYVTPNIPYLGPFAFFVSMLIIMFLFGFFHVASYGLMIGTMIWAALIMGLWLVSYITPLGEEPSSISHYLHNASVSILRIIG